MCNFQSKQFVQTENTFDKARVRPQVPARAPRPLAPFVKPYRSLLTRRKGTATGINTSAFALRDHSVLFAGVIAHDLANPGAHTAADSEDGPPDRPLRIRPGRRPGSVDRGPGTTQI